MPRIPTSLLRKARVIDPLLPALLAPCRDLRAAQNELRWLREHVEKDAKTRTTKEKSALLRDLVKQRSSGKPLQHILGTEYFGDLEIRCRHDVLIPRQETAASVIHLAHLLHRAEGLPDELRVLDLCTGTGCMPLLFQHELLSSRDDVRLRLLGVDIAVNAIQLAEHNLKRVRKRDHHAGRWKAEFTLADVLVDPVSDQTVETLRTPHPRVALNRQREPPFWDILISNPPYISPSGYWRTTTRSVRGFEPKLALVPPLPTKACTDAEQGDLFYPNILNIAQGIEAKILLLEVADFDQALRVGRMAKRLEIFDGIEIWRDEPDQGSDSAETHGEKDCEFPVSGSGNGRSVLCWRGAGTRWLGKSIQTEASTQSLPIFSHRSPPIIFKRDIPRYSATFPGISF